jgi:ParB-like chromosome segregation protein Spo0J
MQQKSSIQYTSREVIEVGTRIRQDLGDLSGLADSIKKNGIIVPIGVTPDLELIYGQRRLEAAKLAGIDLVPYIVIETPEDDAFYRRMEILENTGRKDFTIEEKIRIVDAIEPKIKALKDKIRTARIRNDEETAEALHGELEMILSRQIDRHAGIREILSDMVGIGQRNLQLAREIVHAADQIGSPQLREIVAEMNKTGQIQPGFSRYLALLPPAPFESHKPTPKADTEEDFESSFYDDEDDSENLQPFESVEAPESEQTSVGKAIGNLINDSDRHIASKKEKKVTEPAQPQGATEKKPEASKKAAKPRGQQRTHRSVSFDEEALRQQHEVFVKKTLRGLDPQHQERALQILTGGSTTELAAAVKMDQEVTDADDAMQRVEKLYEDLPPDHQERLVMMLRDWASSRATMGTQPEDYMPALPEDHEKALEIVTDEMRVRFRGLKSMSQWNFGSVVPAAVRGFMKTTRRRLLEFERHSEVGAEADKTLFEKDADFPAHLATAEFQELFAEWWQERKRRKLSVTPTVKKKQLKLLGIGDVEQASMIVSKAIENSWQGIPDQIWEGTLWCDRVPAHADEKLLKKIKATGAKPATYRSNEEQARDKANRRSIYQEDDE